jgi:predicted NUDIX family NTP pyrophosphohydrolase
LEIFFFFFFFLNTSVSVRDDTFVVGPMITMGWSHRSTGQIPATWVEHLGAGFSSGKMGLRGISSNTRDLEWPQASNPMRGSKPPARV